MLVDAEGVRAAETFQFGQGGKRSEVLAVEAAGQAAAAGATGVCTQPAPSRPILLCLSLNLGLGVA